MFHVVRLSEWNEPIRRREDDGYFKNKECKSRKTSVTLEVVILFVSLDYTSHDTIHKFARTHMFLKCFFCIYNVLIKSFESCHEKDYSWNCTRIQTTLHVRRVSFRTLKVDSRIETRTRDQNAIYWSLSLQREDASCTGASIEWNCLQNESRKSSSYLIS